MNEVLTKFSEAVGDQGVTEKLIEGAETVEVKPPCSHTHEDLPLDGNKVAKLPKKNGGFFDHK